MLKARAGDKNDDNPTKEKEKHNDFADLENVEKFIAFNNVLGYSYSASCLIFNRNL